MNPAARKVLIGVGNPYRQDDGIGPALAAAIAALDPPGVNVLACDGEPSRLLDAWTGAELAVVVDATRHGDGGTPGRIRRFTEDRLADADSSGSASTHGLGLADAVELGRALAQLPERLVVFAVEAQDIGYGNQLSPPVAAALGELTRRVLAELTAEVT